MQITIIRMSQIKVNSSERFRRAFSGDVLGKMQESIGKPPGLMQAIGVEHLGDEEYQLIFGETRMKSIELMHTLGQTVYYNGMEVSEGMIPAIIAPKGLTKIQILKMELEENTIRQGFTFLEEQQAVSRIFKLEQDILTAEAKEVLESSAENSDNNEPVVFHLSKTEVKNIEKAAIAETAAKAFNLPPTPAAIAKVQASVRVAEALENPDIAEKLKSVSNMNEATKVIDRHVREEQHQILAQSVGKNFTSAQHTVIHGDCLEEMKKLASVKNPLLFDVCLTDPIYGIGANKFGDAAGKMSNLSHDYDDSLENFERIMPVALKLMTKLMKNAAHVYLACDLRNYPKLVEYLKEASDPGNPWCIPNAPVIQYKVAGGRVPIPGLTFRRSYEVWLYAYRGGKQEYRMYPDVLECESNHTENHGASKPIELLKMFLSRSSKAGDSVLDFMAGSGGILIAAHQQKVKCTAIEVSETYYGNCVQKLKGLK